MEEEEKFNNQNAILDFTETFNQGGQFGNAQITKLLEFANQYLNYMISIGSIPKESGQRSCYLITINWDIKEEDDFNMLCVLF